MDNKTHCSRCKEELEKPRVADVPHICRKCQMEAQRIKAMARYALQKATKQVLKSREQVYNMA